MPMYLQTEPYSSLYLYSGLLNVNKLPEKKSGAETDACLLHPGELLDEHWDRGALPRWAQRLQLSSRARPENAIVSRIGKFVKIANVTYLRRILNNAVTRANMSVFMQK